MGTITAGLIRDDDHFITLDLNNLYFKVNDGVVDRVTLGKLDTNIYGIRGINSGGYTVITNRRLEY